MPDWLNSLINGHTVAHSVLVLSIVITTGLALGSIKFKGIGLGIAGVLFTGLIAAHYKFNVDKELLEFCREFGLILFVYTVGMQVGPSFFASFKKQGLKLNLLAVSIVLLGVATAITIHFVTKIPIQVVVGLLSGAVTNTPGLGAATQALKDAGVDTSVTGMGYAVAYPFGIIGIILTMLLVRGVMKIDVNKECEEFEKSRASGEDAPQNHNIVVTNAAVAGKNVQALIELIKSEFVVSRILRGDQILVPTPATKIELNDHLHVVSTQGSADKLAMLVGDVSHVDVRTVPSNFSSRGIIVTHKHVVGKSLRQLDLVGRYNVVITRITRAGVDLVASSRQDLAFGDRVTVVGSPEALKDVAAELGDSVKELNHPNILPIFFGIIVGVVIGVIPIFVPGVPAPVKLGLAGGPLLVALCFSRLGKLGPILFYLPQGANLSLREVGITLFLACVGLLSGEKFMDVLLHGDGLYWMALAALITIVPLLIVGFFARAVLKMNYMSLCGLLAGSMTDPPALAFANQVAASDAPSLTYASVYAMTMFMRILTAQAMVLLLLPMVH